MVNVNGNLLNNEEATFTLNNRGYNYGDAVFETIRAINGKIMFWEAHYFRLMASMRIMRMNIPSNFSPEFLEEKILEVLEANNQSQKPARVKINVHRKGGGRYRPNSKEIGYFIRTSSLKNAFYVLDETPYTVELYKDHFVLRDLLSTLKTNNRAVNVLGSIYAEENDYNNCLLLNEKKTVLEALNGNLFLIKGKMLKTTPISEGCLNGIIRKKIIEIVKKSKEFELIEEAISPFELQKADEIFITNVIMGIRPITKYRKKTYTHQVAKRLLAQLNTAARLA